MLIANALTGTTRDAVWERKPLMEARPDRARLSPKRSRHGLSPQQEKLLEQIHNQGPATLTTDQLREVIQFLCVKEGTSTILGRGPRAWAADLVDKTELDEHALLSLLKIPAMSYGFTVAIDAGVVCSVLSQRGLTANVVARIATHVFTALTFRTDSRVRNPAQSCLNRLAQHPFGTAMVKWQARLRNPSPDLFRDNLPRLGAVGLSACEVLDTLLEDRRGPKLWWLEDADAADLIDLAVRLG